MISVKNITKTYKKKNREGECGKKDKIVALDNINLEISKGEIFGLIGPNGAGKTTLLKILSTIIIPDNGTALIDGSDILNDSNDVKCKSSLLAGEFVRSLYWRLSGRENMKFFANLKNIWEPDERIDYLFELFELTDHQNEMVMKYSTGMKHKLALAVGLINDPSVIFLDEPLTGIDPITAYEIKKIIKNKFKEKTIIWTSHNLFEMEEMCDRIALINKGKIILQGSPDKLKSQHWGYEKIRIVCDNPKKLLSIKNVEINEDYVEIITNNLNGTLIKILELLHDEKIRISEIKTLRPTLEDIFLKGVKDA